ncbi:MAG: methyltransferase domain-containing protein [Zoogloeaceae bacterium]|nr:methyltransferase domain-containing protein [Zoogloeaceae bacterium]
MTAIAGLDKAQILDAVRCMYTEVATRPDTPFHFPTGGEACVFVGYPVGWLQGLPVPALESFAGVGFPFRAEAVCAGDRVLDVGSGSGTDVLIASRLAGAAGSVIAFDMTPAMLAKLKRNVARASNVGIVQGEAGAIPLADRTVDAVTSNGVLNLVPDKRAAIGEIWRVLRPGGRVQIADIVLGRPVGQASRSNPKLWAECVVGASLEDDYIALFRQQGFSAVTVLRRFDYFSGSRNPDTRRVAQALGACAIEITMQRPS